MMGIERTMDLVQAYMSKQRGRKIMGVERTMDLKLVKKQRI